MSKSLSTVRNLMAEYKMGFVVGDKDIDAHYDAFEAQLRSLVEKFAEELIGEDEIYRGKTSPRRYQLDRIYNINDLRSEQRENVPKLLDQIFGGRDE